MADPVPAYGNAGDQLPISETDAVQETDRNKVIFEPKLVVAVEV